MARSCRGQRPAAGDAPAYDVAVASPEDAAAGPGAATARAEDEVAWLSPEQLRDWRSVVAMMMTLSAALDADLKCHAGINSFEYHVLAALSEADDHTVPMSVLARMSQGSLSRLSHAVSRLEKVGWVRRVALAGRRIDAQLTPLGWEKVVATAPGHVREVRRLVVDTLTPEQLEALGAAARIVTAAADREIAEALGQTDPPEVSC